MSQPVIVISSDVLVNGLVTIAVVLVLYMLIRLSK